MTADRDLVALGECMVELSSVEPLSTAATLTVRYAGDVLNSLTVAARLGARTGFITRVGRDPFAERMRGTWLAEGVDLTHARLVEGVNGVYFISLDENGEREFTYRRAGSAASTLAPEDVDPAYLAGSRALLLSGITQAISASAQRATAHAARVAREAGCLVAYDPNYRPALWAARGGPEAARAAAAEVLPWVDVLLPSTPSDLVALTAAPVPDGAAHGAAAHALLAGLAPTVAVKDGAAGVHVGPPGRSEHVAPAPPDRVVDTSGAGDAWNAAFLVALLRGDEVAAAARAANRVAGRTVAHRGAIPPRDAELTLD
ncbi:sugar kinase [Marinitenerispora sediminis]|uniref:Sugar kinase n=1 Tax=Marinitenerispora sediminis TaxID=1931232 RepID=A0A368T226_9ACTN|nr:sugar kinase [Marinitenerispora sediminis]RCV49203.1 sugar kinase [Marinitenerispora sediminis]RCV51536.1 sugar kinase [Marinitenerispora sediminis]RCV55117.1 sugar kinase [Marinitenerispora sediminis]